MCVCVCVCVCVIPPSFPIIFHQDLSGEVEVLFCVGPDEFYIFLKDLFFCIFLLDMMD